MLLQLPKGLHPLRRHPQKRNLLKSLNQQPKHPLPRNLLNLPKSRNLQPKHQPRSLWLQRLLLNLQSLPQHPRTVLSPPLFLCKTLQCSTSARLNWKN